jgi:hypothetical protein
MKAIVAERGWGTVKNTSSRAESRRVTLRGLWFIQSPCSVDEAPDVASLGERSVSLGAFILPLSFVLDHRTASAALGKPSRYRHP